MWSIFTSSTSTSSSILLLLLFLNFIFSTIIARKFESKFDEEITHGILQTMPKITESCTVTVISSDPWESYFFNSRPIIVKNFNRNATSIYHYFRHSPSCGIGIYEKFSRNYLSETSLGEYFIRKSPGGLFQSYHIILNFPLKEMTGFRVNSLVKQMHHVIFISPNARDPSSAIIFTPNVWFNETIVLGNFFNRKIRIKTSGLFYDKWHDLKGATLRMATTPDVTVPEMKAYDKTGIVTRYIVTAAFEYLRYINATPEAKAVKPGVYGSKGKDGKWNGMVGALIDGTAEMSTVTGFAHERTEVITYTRPFYYDKAIFVTGLPKEIIVNGSLEFLARPLGGFVWLGIFISLLAIYSTMLLNKIMRRNRTSEPSNSKYFSVLLLNMLLRPVLDQTADTPNLTRRTKDRVSRGLFTLWLLSIIVLGTLYRCRLISFLLSPEMTTPPRTFLELVDSPYEIGTVLYNESLLGDYFRPMKNRIGTEVRQRVKGYPFLKPECYTETRTKDDHCCMGVGNLLEISSNFFSVDDQGQKLYRISRDSLFFIMAGFAVSVKFPHLTEPVNRIIGRKEQQGFLEFWLSEEKRVTKVRGRTLAKSNKAAGINQEDKLEKSQIIYLINISLIGLGASFGLFLIEQIFFRWQMFKGKVQVLKETGNTSGRSSASSVDTARTGRSCHSGSLSV